MQKTVGGYVMKWSLNPRPTVGEVRVIKKFAILPMRVGNSMVWLEPILIQQEYRRFTYDTIDGIYTSDKWFTTNIQAYKK